MTRQFYAAVISSKLKWGFLGVFVLSVSIQAAETFNLKTGEVVIGTVIERSDTMVVVESATFGQITLELSQLVDNEDTASKIAQSPSLNPQSDKAELPAETLQDEEEPVPFINRITGLPGKFEIVSEVGLTLVKNENEVNVVDLLFMPKWTFGKNELMMLNSYTTVEVDGTSVQERRIHSLRYSRELSERWRWLNQYDWITDPLSSTETLWQFVSVPTYYFVKNDTFTFLGGIGAGYQSVDYAVTSLTDDELASFKTERSHAAAFVYQLFRWKLTEDLTFEQTFLGAASVESDFQTFDMRLSLSEKVTDNLSLRFEWENSYLSEPIPSNPSINSTMSLVLRHTL